jgi:uncharacterized membrane protein
MSSDSQQFFRKQTVQVILGLLFISFFLHGASASAAEGYENQEHIRSFDVQLTVAADSSVRVRESISYHFVSEKHGIFRDIPVKYTDRLGRNKNRTRRGTVTDERGVPYRFTLASVGKNRQIKIGDPEMLVTGDHTYVISYRVHFAIGYFDTVDELYWNATGNEWPVPIRAVSVEMVTPVPVRWADWQVACYRGSVGSTVSCGNKHDTLFPYADADQVESIVITSTAEALAPYEGITVAFGFPKGLVSQPTRLDRATLFVQDNPVVLFPILVFGTMFTLWYRRGRDPQGRGVIIPEYDVPSGLSILEIAGLMRNRISVKEISAAIIDLAVRGYIRIEKTIEDKLIFDTEDYIFHRLEKEPPAGSMEEHLLNALFSSQLNIKQQLAVKKLMTSPLTRIFPKLQGLFAGKMSKNDERSVKLSDLKNTFHTHVQALETVALDALVAKKYLAQNPKKLVGKYIGWGVLALFLTVFFGLIDGLVSALAVAFSAAIYGVFAWLMPQVTREGALAKEHILGLKEYLQIAEKNRIEFHNAPEKNPALFEKFLPAAMILGVTALWVKEFANIAIQPPEWYSGPIGTHFSAVSFGSELDSFSSAAATSLASVPGSASGSGGGGFSGGGSGGGGGGSW